MSSVPAAAVPTAAPVRSTRRVLLLAPVGEKGGAEVVLLDIARGLDRSRYEPVVLCLKPGPFVEEARSHGIEAHSLPGFKTRELHKAAAAVGRITRFVRDERIDLVHGNGNTMMVYGGIPARRNRVPAVWHVHDPLSGRGLFERAYVALQRRLEPSWTIFNTTLTRDSYLGTYRNLRRHDVILPGVDARALELGADAGRARARWGIPLDAPIIAMFARLQRGKGHLDLIEAAVSVTARFPDARFLVCGGGLFGMEPEYPDELRARIAEKKLGDNFVLTGYVSEEERRDIFAAADIVVHPAHFEPFGLSVIEGMAAGKPVVVTDCPGPSRTVVHGETGLIVPRHAPAELAGALYALLAEPARAARMGEQGRRRVAENYSTEAMVVQVERVYAELLPPRPAG